MNILTLLGILFIAHFLYFKTKRHNVNSGEGESEGRDS